jgi:hypothetical protein
MINTDPKTKEALDAVLKQIDFNTLKASDVLADLASTNQAAGFRLLVGAALLEGIAKRDAVASAPAPEAAPEQAQEEQQS